MSGILDLNDMYQRLCNSGSAALTEGNYYPPATEGFIPVRDFERFKFEIIGISTSGSAKFDVYQADDSGSSANLKAISGATITSGSASLANTINEILVQTNKLDGDNDYAYVTLKATSLNTTKAAIKFVGLNPNQKPVTQYASTYGQSAEVSG